MLEKLQETHNNQPSDFWLSAEEKIDTGVSCGGGGEYWEEALGVSLESGEAQEAETVGQTEASKCRTV